jgi:hypothetical protein
MTYQATFERYEIKYLLTADQKQALLAAMGPYMAPDQYGETMIRNIYFDTASYRLIRRSLESPAYKEKLRIRSYQPAGPDDPVFVELKKKVHAVVYKRRLSLPEAQARSSFRTGAPLPVASQIADEIDYFREFYGTLSPAVFLCYQRTAYLAKDGSGLRITFDEDIRYRDHDFALSGRTYGTPLLAPGQTLLEIKTSGHLPLWLSHTLHQLGIRKTSFSKYGAAYKEMMADKAIGERSIRYA